MAERVCFRVTGIKTKNTITKTMKHNERKEGDRTGKHINKDLSEYNKCLYGPKECDLWRELVEAIKEKRVDEEKWVDVKDTIYKNDLRFKNGDKIRKDAVLAAEIEVHYPGETKDDEHGIPKAVDPERFSAWEEETVQFILDKFGGDTGKNVKQIVEHFDESGKPHMHAVFIPMYTNEAGQQRLSYHKFVDGPQDLARIQTEYAKAVEHLGFERGVEKSEVQRYDSLKRTRGLLTKSIDAKLPKPEKNEDIDAYWKRASEEYEKVLVQRDNFELNNKRMYAIHERSGEKDKQIHAQEATIEALKSQNASLDQEIRRLQMELLEAKREKELEKIGMNMYSDRELLEQVYMPLQKQFLDTGEKYAIEHGLVLGDEKEIPDPDQNGDK